MSTTDYAKIGAKAKFIQNIEENRRIAQAYPGIDQEVAKEIQSQRMAHARASKATTTPVRRRGRKPGSKNKAKTATTGATTQPTQTQERRDAVDELSGLNG